MAVTMSVLQISTCSILNWKVASIVCTYPALSYKIMVLLTFCQDLTYPKPDLQQSDSGASRAMWHKIQTALDFTVRIAQKSILHIPTVSWLLITREAINYQYLLDVNNNQQRHKLNSGSSLLDLPFALETLSLLHQWHVTSQALKPVISLPHWTDVRHDSLQEIPLYKTSRYHHVQRSLPGIPVRNQTHPIATFHLSLIIWTFELPSNQ